MEALIRKVVLLEQQGKDVVKAARERQTTIEDEITQNKELIESEIKTKLKNKLEQIRTSEAAEGVERVKVINAETEKQLAHIRGRFDENKGAWEDELFNKIVGR